MQVPVLLPHLRRFVLSLHLSLACLQGVGFLFGRKFFQNRQALGGYLGYKLSLYFGAVQEFLSSGDIPAELTFLLNQEDFSLGFFNTWGLSHEP